MLTRLPPAMRLSGLGFYIALCIIGGIAAGLAMDGWLETKPLFTLVGLFAGLAVAFAGGYLLLLEVLRPRGRDG